MNTIELLGLNSKMKQVSRIRTLAIHGQRGMPEVRIGVAAIVCVPVFLLSAGATMILGWTGSLVFPINAGIAFFFSCAFWRISPWPNARWHRLLCRIALYQPIEARSFELLKTEMDQNRLDWDVVIAWTNIETQALEIGKTCSSVGEPYRHRKWPWSYGNTDKQMQPF